MSAFADLTDWQIVHLYLIPAAKRAEQMERERKGIPSLTEPEVDAPPKMPTKAYIVGLLMQRGWPKDKAEEEYEKQLALTLKKQQEGK